MRHWPRSSFTVACAVVALPLGASATAMPPVAAPAATLAAVPSASGTQGGDDGQSRQHERRIAEALGLAGANRGEIAAFLARYDDCGDAEKRDASRWLVANMEGHGFARIELCDREGRELGFDALQFASLGEAQARLDELERAHPGAEFRRVAFESDLSRATDAFLSAHLEQAFDAWRTLPWGRSIGYEAFREHILPYRGSNEPLVLWRAPAAERLAPVVAELRASGASDVREIGERMRATSHPWVAFSDLFYVHPTDQGYGEMCERKRGRCEDITNMVSFGMRSVATMCASDYTPWWAASDNNHAWEVVLDERGQGRAGLAGKAAKVYRKTFAHQPCSLGARKKDGEAVPRWLSGTHYVDVTAQYQPTTDLTVEIDAGAAGGAPHRHAYLAVFNGGAWRPIHWAAIEDGRARFTAMGRDICYLPMLHVADDGPASASAPSQDEGRDIPAGPPFLLDRDGRMHVLAGRGMKAASLEATVTKPDIQDPDTGVVRARTQVRPDAAYELFVWRGGAWTSLGRIERAAEGGGAGGRTFDGLPDDGLFWLVEDGSRRLERIFTVEGGRQVFW